MWLVKGLGLPIRAISNVVPSHLCFCLVEGWFSIPRCFLVGIESCVQWYPQWHFSRGMCWIFHDAFVVLLGIRFVHGCAVSFHVNWRKGRKRRKGVFVRARRWWVSVSDCEDSAVGWRLTASKYCFLRTSTLGRNSYHKVLTCACTFWTKIDELESTSCNCTY